MRAALFVLTLALAGSCTFDDVAAEGEGEERPELGEGEGVAEACDVIETDDSPYSLQFDCALVVACGVHGRCRGSDFACTCDQGWAGLACDECAATHADVDGECVNPCGPCEGRVCNGDPLNPACEGCARGRTGADCGECVDGFEEVGEGDFTGCLPDDCTTSCASDRRCVVNDDGTQSCACRTSYVTEADGTCGPLTPIENGDFSDGCAAWSLVQYSVNDGVARAEVLRFAKDDGDSLELHLLVENACSAASAMATVNTPGDVTLPNAAIEFRARGNEGGRMRISTSRSSESRQVEVAGTGRTETIRVCLGAAAQRVLDFTVGVSSPLCLEADDSEFFVDDVVFVSAPECIGPGL